jgi:hypothetical protein
MWQLKRQTEEERNGGIYRSEQALAENQLAAKVGLLNLERGVFCIIV